MYLIRLDDASEYMNVEKWSQIETLLDEFEIKPIVGVIPCNEDPELLKYERDPFFWRKVHKWEKKGWVVALHGCTHAFETECGGLNPVNKRSEFAGVDLERQCQKIHRGYQTLISYGINPKLFFAPAHTFDENTLSALINETEIRVISDTIANDIYYDKGIYFIPQQSGKVRKLPFSLVTFCYHPNIMCENDFTQLANFLEKNKTMFVSYNSIKLTKRKKDWKDIFLHKLYFLKKFIKSLKIQQNTLQSEM